MRELALFAGAGGGILGGKILGWQTVCAVEIDPYCQRILMQRQDDGLLDPFPIWPDVRTFRGNPWRGLVDVVSGGFPCQDISAAGSGAGIDGEQSGLWSEMARIVREVRPAHVLVENSPMLTSRGLGVVLGDLARLRYDARWGVFSAAGVGAPHLRRRIWIRADANGDRRGEGIAESEARQRKPLARQLGGDVPNADGGRCEVERQPEHADEQSACGREPDGLRQAGRREGSPLADSAGERCEFGPNVEGQEPSGRVRTSGSGEALVDAMRGRYGSENVEIQPARHASLDASWWAVEPDVGRVAHGVASRVDRLRAIGNGQVPAVVVRAWRELAP